MLKEMRRKDKQLSEEQALQVLDSCTYAMLATINKDGTPYCIPISPALEGKTVYIHGFPTGQKTENLMKNPKVCLSAVTRAEVVQEEYSTKFESAVAEGTAEVLTDGDIYLKGLRLICEKYSPDYMNLFERFLAESGKHTAIIKITISQITGKSSFKNK